MEFKKFIDVKHWLDDSFKNTEDDQLMLVNDILSIFREKEQVCNLLEIILDDPPVLQDIAARSYAHVNAFDKIVILSSEQPQYKFRLHIWWPMPTDVAAAKEGFRVHNHRWDFNSVILCGAFRVQHFEVLSNHQPGIDMYEYKYMAADGQDHYRMEFAGSAKLRCNFNGIMKAGDYYALSHTVPHRVTSERENITATLFLHGAVLTPHNDVYADKPIEGYKRVEIEPLAATALSQKLKNLHHFLSQI